jgi:hypothetical protein
MHTSPASFANHHIGPRHLMNTLFSNIISIYYFLNASDHISYLHKISDKIIIIYTLYLCGHV